MILEEVYRSVCETCGRVELQRMTCVVHCQDWPDSICATPIWETNAVLQRGLALLAKYWDELRDFLGLKVRADSQVSQDISTKEQPKRADYVGSPHMLLVPTLSNSSISRC